MPKGSRYVPGILSALLPGLGQLRLGLRREALVFGLPVLIVLLVVAAVFLVNPARATASLVSTEALWGMIALQAAMLAWRLLAVGRSITARRFGPLRARDAVPIAILALAIVLPQAWALAVTNAARLAADQVFHEDDTPGAWQPPSTPTPPPPMPSMTPEQSTSPLPTEPPTPSPTATLERVNVLIIGVDAGAGRPTFLTDTMIVASLDPVAGTVSMISIPRDMVDVPLPDGTLYELKLNTLVSHARRNPGRFPGASGGGHDVLLGAVGTLLEMRIDHYVQVNLDGFVRVIDTLGGVDVNVVRALCDPRYREYGFPNGFAITAGRHHLDGKSALAYARIRRVAGESDFTRAARQQEVLSGVRDALVAGRFLSDPIGLLDALGRTISTNVPRSMLQDLAPWPQQIDRGDTYRGVIGHPLVRTGFDHRGSVQIPDVPALRAFARTLVTEPGVRPGESLRAPERLPGAPSGSGVGSCPGSTPTPPPTATQSAEPSPTGSPTADVSAAPTSAGTPSPTPGPSTTPTPTPDATPAPTTTP